MQTLFKSNLFSGGNKTLTGAKNFVSGGKKLGASIVGTAKNNIVNFSTTAKTLIPQKKDNDKKDGVRDWVNDRLRKNLKLVRDSLRNNIVNFSRAAKTFIPQKKQKKDDKKNSFISNYTDFFGSKKTERTLRKSLKLVRDSLVSTFEIARNLKAAIIGITDNLKTKVKGGGGGLFGGLMGGFGKLFDFMKFLPVLLPLLPLAIPFLKILALGVGAGIAALLLNKGTREAIFGFIKDYAAPIAGFLWGSLKSLVGSLIESIVPKWIRNPLGAITDEFTGGEEFTEKHKELDQRLKDAGMNTKGISENRSKQQIRKSLDGRTEEQEKIFKEVEEERAGLKSQQKGMEGDIKSTLSDIDDERKPGEEKILKEIKSLPFGSPERSQKEKELRLYKKETGNIKNKTREKIKSDVNRSVEEGIEPDKKELREEPKLKSEGSDKRLVTKKDDAPKIDAPLSDIAKLDLYPEPENLGPRVNLTPITFDQGSKTADTQQSQQPMSTGAGSNSPSGNAVTFYSSTNSDDSYTALNAKMTFNIV